MLVPPLDRLLKLPDGVEGLANFAEPPGEFGTVERTNEDDGLMKWDDDGRMRLRRLMPSPSSASMSAVAPLRAIEINW